MLKSLKIFIICLFSNHLLHGQGSLIGLVVDTSEAPIAFVQIFDKNRGKLTETSLDGYFRLELSPGNYNLIFNHSEFENYQIAYISKEAKFDTISLRLLPKPQRLDAVQVSTKWKDPGPKIMRQAIDKRDYWESHMPNNTSTVYIKAFQQLRPNIFRNNTDQEQGDELKPKINANLAEITLVRDFEKPNKIKEVREGVSIRGKKSSLFYLSTTEGDFNIYQNLMSMPALCPLPIMSPLSNSALLAYRFQFDYTYKENGKTIWVINFRGRRSSNATLSGKIHVVDSSFWISRIEYEVPEHLMAEFDRMEVLQSYKINSDNYLLLDSLSFTYEINSNGNKLDGNTQVDFKEIKVNPVFPKNYFGLEISKTTQEAYERDSVYWQDNRSIPLREIELTFINESDSINRIKNSDWYLDSIERETNKLTFTSLVLEGQQLKNRKKGIDFQFQPLWLFYQPWWPGGGRMLLWSRINKTFESKQNIQFIPNLSYGILNNDIRGSVILNTLYDPYHRKRIYIQAGRDFGLINPFAAYVDLFRRDNFYQHNHLTVYHRQELTNGLFLRIRGELSDRQDIASFQFAESGDSLFENNTAVAFTPHKAVFGSIRLSYTPFQKYISEPKQKIILGSAWPTFSVEYRKALPGVLGSTIDFDYLEFQIQHQFPWGLFGTSELRSTSGSFISRKNVSLIDYKYQRRGDDGIFTPPMFAFQTLDSTFTTFGRYYDLHYRHHFNGALVNKVPFMKYLKFYESVGLNLLYAPERRNMFFYEAYAGLDKLFKIWSERMKIGMYYCMGYSNLFEAPRTYWKINFQFYNRTNNSW